MKNRIKKAAPVAKNPAWDQPAPSSLREFESLCRSTPLFKEMNAALPSAPPSEMVAAWRWVQKLLERAIHQTIKDLTQR